MRAAEFLKSIAALSAILVLAYWLACLIILLAT